MDVILLQAGVPWPELKKLTPRQITIYVKAHARYQLQQKIDAMEAALVATIEPKQRQTIVQEWIDSAHGVEKESKAPTGPRQGMSIAEFSQLLLGG